MRVVEPTTLYLERRTRGQSTHKEDGFRQELNRNWNCILVLRLLSVFAQSMYIHCMETASILSLWLLKQIMGNSPSVSSLICEQLRAGHVEDLPAVVPSACIRLAISLHQMRPDLLLVRQHGGQPLLRLMSAVCYGQVNSRSGHLPHKSWSNCCHSPTTAFQS